MPHPSIEFTPIGVLHTPFTSRAGMPIQGGLTPEHHGVLEVDPQWAEGLQDIEGFSHLIVLYLLHRAEPCEALLRRPFMDETPRGIFAIRSPIRPNPIGLSVVRLLSREGARLKISGVDMLDGTPVLDIKPYFAAVDAYPNATAGWATKGLEHTELHTSDDRFGA